jgi:hypothetical protein
MRGGFYPTAMGSILRSGPAFVTSAIITAFKLIRGDKERMGSRARRSLSRAHNTRKVKRSKK